jgi:small-conductance mechanosensitive channel
METLLTLWNTVLIPRSDNSPITIGDIALVVLLILGTILLIQALLFLISRKLKASEMQPDVALVIKRISFYVILVLLAVTVMAVLGIPITIFAFATGAIAIGVGFGAQNIINNFISGWILIAERPIRLNDFIEIDGHYGRVEQVGTRSTRIKRSDGVRMLVPNSILLENTVVNWTLIDREIRTTVRVGVAYGSNPKKVAELLKQVVVSCPGVLKRPVPEFIFADFGDDALIFDAYFWCEVTGEKELRSIRSEIRHGITEAFEQADIVVAFPQRDVHLYAGTPIDVRLEATES